MEGHPEDQGTLLEDTHRTRRTLWEDTHQARIQDFEMGGEFL